ncbi:MAG: metalloregulator ArsR/SmtB family transcription factor [Robiginitomaculum sp.]|nr:metalloregulator ArsR/SmtB family transcription factor [Robiginitomaculum sp.]
MTCTSSKSDGTNTGAFPQIDPNFFKALGDPVRLALVAYMAHLGKPSTVTEVAGCCGIDFSGVSRHLKILREAGIVTAEKRGRKTYYALDAPNANATLRKLSAIFGNNTE